jgi:hypothetical protein
MSNLELGLVVFVVMMLLIMLRMPIAIALFLGGTIGFAPRASSRTRPCATNEGVTTWRILPST